MLVLKIVFFLCGSVIVGVALPMNSGTPAMLLLCKIITAVFSGFGMAFVYDHLFLEED
jgi:hypothetical protein